MLSSSLEMDIWFMVRRSVEDGLNGFVVLSCGAAICQIAQLEFLGAPQALQCLTLLTGSTAYCVPCGRLGGGVPHVFTFQYSTITHGLECGIVCLRPS